MSHETGDWRAAVERQRRRKDEHFAEDHRSPIPREDRAEFDGLAYYPVDADYRFELDLHEFDEGGAVTVSTSTGTEREYHRRGEFRFEVAGEAVSLVAYRSDPDDDRLWVPFRDATGGETTYGAGRYLDLEPDAHRTDGRWILDFNLAYNPTCAYSDRYECPLPPNENWLDVPIEAGEKRYPLAD